MLQIKFIPREIQHSEYDWADLSQNEQPVGKVRCQISGNSITIYSINIYPEWKGHGFGRSFVEHCKANYARVIADRVRATAKGFWETVGFRDNHDGNWIFEK